MCTAVVDERDDHRSKLSNLSSWKEETWKKSDFFQASSFQLLKLDNLLRWSSLSSISEMSDCSVKRTEKALMQSLLFRCFSLSLPHLRTLPQEKRSKNCLRFGTGGQSLCLYQLLSRNIIFSSSLLLLPLAQKKKILANRFAHAISEDYRDFEHAYVYWIWLRGSASYVINRE